MARSPISLRTLAALILLAVLGAVFAGMGRWQLDRAAQRDALRQAIEQGRGQSPLDLSMDVPPSALIDWRPARATGTWLNDFTVLLDNRNFKGRPGFWVATPLMIDPQRRGAVLVLRGWIPRPVGMDEALPAIPAPSEPRQVEGEMLHRVPRLLELWSLGGKPAANPLQAGLPAPDGRLPRLQNLDLADYASATGLQLLPVVLEQTRPDSAIPAAPPSATADGGASLVREWPGPSVDSHQNRGYALQWFSFAAIAIAAWLAVAWRAWRRSGQRKPSA